MVITLNAPLASSSMTKIKVNLLRSPSKIMIAKLTVELFSLGDFFAVRMTEDTVFGTPVFTTM